jgi:arylsulfatase A-like enzyme
MRTAGESRDDSSMPRHPSPRWFAPRQSDLTLLVMAAWFGIAAGLVEGLGLMLFKRLNAQRWGPMVHVSLPILWISPLVDVILYLLVVLFIMAASRLWPRLPVFRTALFVLIALTAYDWLVVPNRLYHAASVMLALGTAAALTRLLQKRQDRAARFWRRSLPVLAAVLVAVFASIQGGSRLKERRALAQLPSATADSPNVVVIIVDTLRADHLSAYGYPRSTTPNIDRLAAEGVLFENAVAASSWTYPSHVSLLTGRYPFEDDADALPPMPLWGPATNFKNCPTLGEVFEHMGYRTAGFSANRIYFNRDLGFERGFTHFEDYFQSATDMFYRTLFGRELRRRVMSRTYNSWPKRFLRFLRLGFLEDVDAEGAARKRARAVNQELLDWIDKGPSSHPFLAVLNYFDVHDPYGAPDGYPKPAWKQDQPVDEYDNGLKYVDDSIGILMQQFRQRGLDHKTLLVITSDHGESFGEHGLIHHGQSLYWNLIHVPLIFWYPEHIPAGVRVRTVVSNSSLAATLAGEAGGGARNPLPGQSLAALWDSPTTAPVWPDAFSEIAHDQLHALTDDKDERVVPTGLDGPMKSVVSGEWHLIVHKRLGRQLYHWASDPEEANNLIQSPEGDTIAGEMVLRLHNMLAGSFRRGHLNPATYTLTGHNALRTRRIAIAHRLNDYYHILARAGSRIRVVVRAAQVEEAASFDPVLSIENAAGKVYKTCRNPGDDQTPSPGIADPTPDAFDDICVNDDINPGVDNDALLELLVPAGGTSPTDLYLRVSDWTGHIVSPGTSYGIDVSEAASEAVPSKALASQKVPD